MSHALVWFRQDLRLVDNPALAAAIESGQTPVPIYIHDESQSQWSPGAASAWWLHHSLVALQRSLIELGSGLLVFRGDAEQIMQTLVHEHQCTAVYWNRCYEPDAIARDKNIKNKLREQEVDCQSFNGSLLIEPWQHLKKDETPYRVFTPFWKALSSRLDYFESKPAPEKLPAIPAVMMRDALGIDALNLLPDIAWDEGLRASWQPGEAGAHAQLEKFVEQVMIDYPGGRDIPGKAGTSRLSPHLHFGEIGPRQVWNTVQQVMQQDPGAGVIKGGESFLREVGWREFSYHLLYHFPQTSDQPLDQRFTVFPWRDDYEEDLRHWQRGQTGIPIVDAGMRELWSTGWMHNRVRMIVASLLTKNLLIPWQEGARWFWDTLVDADLANNTQGWQWTAGCGADAAPYFRIFNPVLQGERFDPEGRYVQQWVPELKDLPGKWVHKPWEAPDDVLAKAGISLSKDYPEPIVDLSATRKRALERWDQVKKRD
jgi:deoxyribodipyrimidine photo-lyase